MDNITEAERFLYRRIEAMENKIEELKAENEQLKENICNCK
jgi:cell division protein FtsB